MRYIQLYGSILQGGSDTRKHQKTPYRHHAKRHDLR